MRWLKERDRDGRSCRKSCVSLCKSPSRGSIFVLASNSSISFIYCAKKTDQSGIQRGLRYEGEPCFNFPNTFCSMALFLVSTCCFTSYTQMASSLKQGSHLLAVCTALHNRTTSMQTINDKNNDPTSMLLVKKAPKVSPHLPGHFRHPRVWRREGNRG